MLTCFVWQYNLCFIFLQLYSAHFQQCRVTVKNIYKVVFLNELIQVFDACTAQFTRRENKEK